MMRTAALRLKPSDDVRRALRDYCVANEIDAAIVLGAVGSLHGASIRFAGAGTSKRIDGKLEVIALNGTLSRRGCHLHIAVADAHGTLIGGHLVEGSHVHTTLEVVIGILSGMVFSRDIDPATGFAELSIETVAPRQGDIPGVR